MLSVMALLIVYLCLFVVILHSMRIWYGFFWYMITILTSLPWLGGDVTYAQALRCCYISNRLEKNKRHIIIMLRNHVIYLSCVLRNWWHDIHFAILSCYLFVFFLNDVDSKEEWNMRYSHVESCNVSIIREENIWNVILNEISNFPCDHRLGDTIY